MESLELVNSRMKDKLEEAHQNVVARNAQKQRLPASRQYSSLEEIPRPLSNTAATDQGSKPGVCSLFGSLILLIEGNAAAYQQSR